MPRLMLCTLSCTVLLLCLTASLPAEESSGSNTVGFWKLEVGHGFTQISFPLLPLDKSVNNVLSNQLTGGAAPAQSDQVLRWNAAASLWEMCWRNAASGNWEGDFDRFIESESYWIYVQPNHPAAQTMVTCGNVIQAPYFDMGTMSPGYNAIGSVWAVPAAVSQAGLNGMVGGMYLFQSDLVLGYDAATGSYSYAWRSQTGDWLGNLTQFEPLHGYWVYVAPGHAGFAWAQYPQPLTTVNHYIAPPNMGPLNQGLVPPSHRNPGFPPPQPKVMSKPARDDVKTQGGEE